MNGHGDTEKQIVFKKHIKPTVHVEISLKPHCNADDQTIESEVKKELVHYLQKPLQNFKSEILNQNVSYISMSDLPKQLLLSNTDIDYSKTNVCFYKFRLHDSLAQEENLNEEEDLSAASNWVLPAMEFDGLWESLIYDENIKEKLINYAAVTLHYADLGVKDKLISWNKVILLHGPPGTGKTSLARALAQKLSIRFSNRYRFSSLLEINSHSLFSKWFSESGKLVMKLFQKIEELVDDGNVFVFILIDEIESLAAARQCHNSGVEPSDAIRVVNSLLTELDKIKRHPNVMILTTSNITRKIDLAFLDRADIKQYIGPPSPKAIYQIYLSCIEELNRVLIIKERKIFETPEKVAKLFNDTKIQSEQLYAPSLKLFSIAQKSYGLSGRVLRKLPFLAQANYVTTATMTLDDFFQALSLSVDLKFCEMKNLDGPKSDESKCTNADYS